MATKSVTKKEEAVVKAEPVVAKTLPVTVKAEPAKKKAAGQKTNAEKKPVEKKAPVKRAVTKKDMAVNLVVEFGDRQVEQKDMVSAVKKAWTKSGKKVGDIKTMDLYIKPEEGAVYYVINGDHTGAAPF